MHISECVFIFSSDLSVVLLITFDQNALYIISDEDYPAVHPKALYPDFKKNRDTHRTMSYDLAHSESDLSDQEGWSLFNIELPWTRFPVNNDPVMWR